MMQKMLLNLLKMLLLASSILLFGLSQAAVTSDQFCWLNSYGRGVGTIPTHCGDGQDNDAALCYPSCKSGYTGVGPVCWQQCPSGYTDTGAFCHINKPLVVTGTWSWSTWETDCPNGYGLGFAGMCSLNESSPPEGMRGTYLDPIKNSYGRGAGTIPTGCPNGDYDAGLCYSNCNAGYSGVGPVCWNSCPAGKQACGMGCADNGEVCTAVVANQVVNSLQLVAIIASAGAAGPAMKAATAAQSTSRTEKAMASLKAISAEVMPVLKNANDRRKMLNLLESNSPEESIRNAAALDPTGIVATGMSFAYPVCNRNEPARAPYPPPGARDGGADSETATWLTQYMGTMTPTRTAWMPYEVSNPKAAIIDGNFNFVVGVDSRWRIPTGVSSYEVPQKRVLLADSPAKVYVLPRQSFSIREWRANGPGGDQQRAVVKSDVDATSSNGYWNPDDDRGGYMGVLLEVLDGIQYPPGGNAGVIKIGVFGNHCWGKNCHTLIVRADDPGADWRQAVVNGTANGAYQLSFTGWAFTDEWVRRNGAKVTVNGIEYMLRRTARIWADDHVAYCSNPSVQGSLNEMLQGGACGNRDLSTDSKFAFWTIDHGVQVSVEQIIRSANKPLYRMPGDPAGIQRLIDQADSFVMPKPMTSTFQK